MGRKGRKRKAERQRKKTLKEVKGLLNEMVDVVVESAQPELYFNIYKVATSEIDFLIDLDVKNLDMLNGLHSEKARREGGFTIVYVRKNKLPDLDPWTVYNDGTDKYLISNIVIADIRNNISEGYSDIHIAKFYIQNDANVVNTILYILDPDIFERERVEYTEEQKLHNNIRRVLDEKNEVFNNRMKGNPSIKKLQELKAKSI